MENQPLVSIIIPTYNRAHLIGETLDSILAQTYQNWECIIVDDGSNDNTDDVVGSYVKKDNRFKYFHRPDEHLPGGNGARNYGFKMSQGEYVNWLDSDDLFSENKIEEQVKTAIFKNSDVVTCSWKLSSNRNIKNLSVFKDYNKPQDFFKDLYADIGYFPHHVYLVNRNLLYRNSLWNEYLRINQDGVMFSSLLHNARIISFSKNGFCVYRETRNDSISLLNNNKIVQLISSIKLIEEIHKISLNGELPLNFNNYKWKAYLRIPRSYYKELKKDLFYFHEEMKKQKQNESFKKKINLFIKSILNK